MEKNDTIYTKTMAKVYVSQGHFENAARVYQHLLEKNPNQTDIRALYEGVKKTIESNRFEKKEKLGRLLEQWLNLLVRQGSLNQLKTRIDAIHTQSRRR